ncbi:ketosteroid isomerase [Mycobacterium branderi]|uniref:Ketosteroid isomerase n=2 Tax=Mycobacterium branderi TaxID=43348 RepID=A0ABM7KG05_9MYCO|nr:ketosteroid isomerase [Mycobacterium branderi]
MAAQLGTTRSDPGPAMPSADAATITAVADQLFTAIENSDTATVARLWSDDIAVWRVGASRDRDKVRALRVIDWFVGATARRRYEILDRQLFADGFVQQHILHATGHNGGSIAMRVCIVIKLESSPGSQTLISRIDEYFDPAELAPLLG